MNEQQLIAFLRQLPLGALWRFEQVCAWDPKGYSWLYEKVEPDMHDFVNTGRYPDRKTSEASIIQDAKIAMERYKWTVTFRRADGETVPDSYKPAPTIKCPHCKGTGQIAAELRQA